jgi:hypothetical protein
MIKDVHVHKMLMISYHTMPIETLVNTLLTSVKSNKHEVLSFRCAVTQVTSTGMHTMKNGDIISQCRLLSGGPIRNY